MSTWANRTSEQDHVNADYPLARESNEPEQDHVNPAYPHKWKLTQKELVLQPTFLYRFTMLSHAVVPFAGIGPRIYLLQSVVEGSAGGEKFLETKETSTKFGFGVPLGVELPLGPGGLMAELLFQWGPLKHETTGKTHLGSLSLLLGYRALL